MEALDRPGLSEQAEPADHVRWPRLRLAPHLPWLPLAIAITIVVVSLAPLAIGALRAPGAPMEEGKLLTAAELVLDGKVPHRDFEHFYGPADVWSIASAFTVLGRSLLVERLLGLCYYAGIVAAVFALVRRFTLVGATLAACASGMILVPFGVHAYSWSAGLALVLTAVALLAALIDRNRAGSDEGRPSSRRLAFLAGAAAGLALLYRADLVVALGAIALLLGSWLTGRQRRTALWGVVLAGAVPYLVHVAVAGPGPVFDGMVRDTLFHLRDGRKLPVPPPGGALTAWLDLSAPDPPTSRILPDLALVNQLRAFFWLTVLGVVAMAAVGVLAWFRHRGHRDTPVLVAFGALAVGIAPQMVQRADATHVRFVACVVLPLAPIAVAAGVSLIDRKLPRAVAMVELLVVSMAVLVLVVPYYTARLASVDLRWGVGARDPASLSNRGRSFPVIDPLVPDATAVLDLVERVAPEHGRLFVGPQDLKLANYSDAFLYWLLPQLDPASFYLESNPGIANAPDSTLAEDMAGADVLVLSKEYDNWDEPNASREPGPTAPLDVVRDDFCLAGEAGRYEVYLREGRC